MTTPLGGLRTLIYPAPDLDAAKSWWSEFLGYPPYFDEPFYVGYDVAGYELGLVPDAESGDGATAYWAVDDVAGSIVASTDLGAVVREEANDVGEGLVVGSVRTPQGSIVGFINNPHFVAKG